ncbi:MAG: M20/M25/M40 family metallo-hydrolase [Thermoplasmata archaeon]|nr:M20/M25/M40 family metallo-hydrolase [Thermoplasmata archaeon]
MPEPALDPAVVLGDGAGLELLRELVALSPTNLEDPPRARYEKPNYPRAAERIARAAREWGLESTIFDPVAGAHPDPELRSIPRPNVIVDLDVRAPRRLLVLAHYDVVPVPVEQRARWQSDPHTLVQRPDGRWYGRGSNDDLGSGVVASLLALRRLRSGPPPPVNVRLIVCCDEETGGDGGIESIKAHDDQLPPDDTQRFLVAEAALIPDGHLRTTPGSSGLAFLDAGFPQEQRLETALGLGEALVRLHETARQWRSKYLSPDWPDHGAPEPVITGRATVTKFELTGHVAGPGRPWLLAARAESDAANQIAESVTLVFHGTEAEFDTLDGRLRALVRAPYRLRSAGPSSLTVPSGARSWQVVGQSAHAGYPHSARNPVPVALTLLRSLAESGTLASDDSVQVSYSVDLRLIPEMELDAGVNEALAVARSWAKVHAPTATIEAPPARRRAGYALPVDHPVVVRMERILGKYTGEHGVVGEYGGTDASSLRELRTPSGEPLPAVVFGSMDRPSHIHDAEESVDPRYLAAVSLAIEEFVRSF